MGRILDSCKRKKADGAILIDYPDFNLRLAKKLKKAGIPVYYYISPTIWAWRYSRIKIIRKYVDHMFIIFPFEQEIYKKEIIPFTYTGHPLIPSIKINKERDIFRKELNIIDGEKVLSLLPGSRLSEIESLLPEMLSAIKILRSQFKLKAIILKADNINNEIIEKIIDSSGIEVEIINQKNRYDLFNASDAALASCGTSNLELAVCGLPFVAVYKVNKLSYLLGKGFLKISLYSIVNILLKKKVVSEFIQNKFTAKNCAEAVSILLSDQDKADEQRREFLGLKEMLSLKSSPSEIIFNKLVSLIFNNK
ncbi:MAG: lipid-A-disaccharide synthase, partial [Candidatus Aminicenantes bacterium]|nr:lipid-A-disaccharide synthase [Candidatus Aminicenantes bacterium]